MTGYHCTLRIVINVYYDITSTLFLFLSLSFSIPTICIVLLLTGVCLTTNSTQFYPMCRSRVSFGSLLSETTLFGVSRWSGRRMAIESAWETGSCSGHGTRRTLQIHLSTGYWLTKSAASDDAKKRDKKEKDEEGKKRKDPRTWQGGSMYVVRQVARAEFLHVANMFLLGTASQQALWPTTKPSRSGKWKESRIFFGNVYELLYVKYSVH